MQIIKRNLTARRKNGCLSLCNDRRQERNNTRVQATINLRIIALTPTGIDINLHFVGTNSTVCVGVSTGQHMRPAGRQLKKQMNRERFMRYSLLFYNSNSNRFKSTNIASI